MKTGLERLTCRTELRPNDPLEAALDEFRPGDVFIKGANAVNVNGNAGVGFRRSGQRARV